MKRGRNQRRRQGVNPNRAYDSNGPDVRIRGTANQIYDKYLSLARDATSAGDPVRAENYLQHAEHYFRLIRAMQPQQTPNPDYDDAQPYEANGYGGGRRREEDGNRDGQRDNQRDGPRSGRGAPNGQGGQPDQQGQAAAGGDGAQPEKETDKPNADAAGEAAEDGDRAPARPRRRAAPRARAAAKPAGDEENADASAAPAAGEGGEDAAQPRRKRRARAPRAESSDVEATADSEEAAAS